MGKSYQVNTGNLNFCMVCVDVNVESARRKCQDLYVVRSTTYGGMSWHFRSVAVNGRLGKTLTSMVERSTFGNTTHILLLLSIPGDFWLAGCFLAVVVQGFWSELLTKLDSPLQSSIYNALTEILSPPNTLAYSIYPPSQIPQVSRLGASILAVDVDLFYTTHEPCSLTDVRK